MAGLWGVPPPLMTFVSPPPVPLNPVRAGSGVPGISGWEEARPLCIPAQDVTDTLTKTNTPIHVHTHTHSGTRQVTYSLTRRQTQRSKAHMGALSQRHTPTHNYVN